MCDFFWECPRRFAKYGAMSGDFAGKLQGEHTISVCCLKEGASEGRMAVKARACPRHQQEPGMAFSCLFPAKFLEFAREPSRFFFFEKGDGLHSFRCRGGMACIFSLLGCCLVDTYTGSGQKNGEHILMLEKTLLKT
jgi:hypothetical protein